MKEERILNETLPALSQNWEIESASQGTKEEIILAMLENRIAEMLKNEMETLVNAMYRLDVRENLFHEAMALPGIKERAAAIARLVLDREYQKAETRLKYKT